MNTRGRLKPPPDAQSLRIVLDYDAVDGVHKRGYFKTLRGARKWAQEWVGQYPEIGRTYAIAGDGIGKITIASGTTLKDLFPSQEDEPC